MKELPLSDFLGEAEIEKKLLNDASLQEFWAQNASLLLFRTRPSLADPLYEIQLVWDLTDRIETYAWLWVDAREGSIIRRFPES